VVSQVFIVLTAADWHSIVHRSIWLCPTCSEGCSCLGVVDCHHRWYLEHYRPGLWPSKSHSCLHSSILCDRSK